tara:strand:+ start:2554 stop:2883 length:330 start_codon:yes stop_codon:yes gene_type:complete
MQDFDEMSTSLEDTDKDIPLTRTISLNDGNFLHLRKEPVFGFWRFHLDKGKLPAFMDTTFTSVSEARKTMQKYLDSKFNRHTQPDLLSKESDPEVVKEAYQTAVKKAFK